MYVKNIWNDAFYHQLTYFYQIKSVRRGLCLSLYNYYYFYKMGLSLGLTYAWLPIEFVSQIRYIKQKSTIVPYMTSILFPVAA